MNVIQSYLTTIMKGDFSVYEIRIFMKVVELANSVIKGTRIAPKIGKAICADGINCNLSFPIRDVLTDGSNSYDRIKKALQALLKKVVQIYDPDKGIWKAATLINNIKVGEHDGLIRFTVPKWLLEYILNMCKGFSRYDLENALSLTSTYAVRFYWLVSSQVEPIDYTLPLLKEMLGCQAHYKSNKDFIKRCVEPARKMLQNKNLNGFNYSKVIEKHKIQSLRIVPVKREERKPEELTARATLSAWCHPLLRQYLSFNCGFRAGELSANKVTLFNFSKLANWQDMLVRIVNRQRKARAGKGYIIAAMKHCIEQEHPETAATGEK